MERPTTLILDAESTKRVEAVLAIRDQLATAVHDAPIDLIKVELNRAHLIVTRLLRELGITDEMPDC